MGEQATIPSVNLFRVGWSKSTAWSRYQSFEQVVTELRSTARRCFHSPERALVGDILCLLGTGGRPDFKAAVFHIRMCAHNR